MRTIRAINQAEYERLILQVNRELNRLRPSVQPEGQHILPMLGDFKSLWRRADHTDRRVLLNIMFDGLYFDHEHKLRKVALNSPFEQILKIEDLAK